MGKFERLCNWLLNPNNRATVALVVGGVAALVGATWALYLYFYIPPPPLIQNIRTTPEQFDAMLQKRRTEVMAQILQADPQHRTLLEKELAAIKAKHDNLQKAYEEQKSRLAEAYQALDQFKQEIPAEQIKQAQQALVRGQTGAAEKLFLQALENSQAVNEKRTAEAAAAAYQLGVLAEGRIDYGQADKYYHQAVQLQPDNPRYLNAAGKINNILGRYRESESLLKRALEIIEKPPKMP